MRKQILARRKILPSPLVMLAALVVGLATLTVAANDFTRELLFSLARNILA